MPLVASFGGYLLLGSPISWLEILLSVVSLFGVLLVASPDAIFSATVDAPATGGPDAVNLVSRIWALCVGLLGVCGSAAAFLCMSVIGKTENPLTVVNYFAALCTVVSVVALLVLPGLGFQAPGNVWEWALLFSSGLSGFLMVRTSFYYCLGRGCNDCITQRTNPPFHLRHRADIRDSTSSCSNSSSPCPCKPKSHWWPSTWSTLRSSLR